MLDQRCYTCEMFTTFYDFGMQYSTDIFQALLPPALILFNACVGLWFGHQLVFKVLIQGEFEAAEFIKSLCLFVFVGSLLHGSNFFWDYIHGPFLNLASAIAQKIITLGKSSIGNPTFEGVIQTVDEALNNSVFQAWHILMNEGNWYTLTLKPMVGAVILMAPYIFVICIFLSFMLEFVFSVLVVTAMMPLLLVCLVFDVTRSFTISAGRIALNGALTLIFACIAMGFTIAVFHKFGPLIPASPEGAHREIAEFVFSKRYWAIFILGFVSVFFHLKASTFASAFAGSIGGPGPAAAVTAAGLGLYASSKRAGWRVATGGAKALGKGAGWTVQKVRGG